jgi:hypothetical protein
MERNVLEAVRAGDAIVAPPVRIRPSRGIVVAGVALAAAGFLAWFWNAGLLDRRGTRALPRVEYRDRGGEVTRSRSFSPTETVETTELEDVTVTLGNTAVRFFHGSRARFGRVDDRMVELRLDQGAVEIQFHPARRGEQTMVLETAALRVEVIGTVFRVEVEAARATRVDVIEGIVRVVPKAQEARLVRAGESIRVAARPSDTAISDPVPADVDPSTGLPALRTVAPATSTDLPLPASGEDDRIEEELAAATNDARGPSAEEAEPLSADVRFDLAEILRGRGEYRRARHELYAVLRTTTLKADKVRAWTMVAETYSREREHLRSAEAYQRAARAGIGTASGRNAIFALALLRERVHNPDGARAAYRGYLEEAPHGAHASLCRAALCRLGDAGFCP